MIHLRVIWIPRWIAWICQFSMSSILWLYQAHHLFIICYFVPYLSELSIFKNLHFLFKLLQLLITDILQLLKTRINLVAFVYYDICFDICLSYIIYIIHICYWLASFVKRVIVTWLGKRLFRVCFFYCYYHILRLFFPFFFLSHPQQYIQNLQLTFKGFIFLRFSGDKTIVLHPFLWNFSF